MATNPILANPTIQASFIDWVDDHRQHVGSYPNAFTYRDENMDETEFTEDQVQDAILSLHSTGELT